MKISKIIFALTTIIFFTITSCNNTKSKSEKHEEHIHQHDADGNHLLENNVEQEEFSIAKDSLQTNEETHPHEKGKGNHNH